MELLLHQWGDWPELYRNTDKTEATEIVIIYSQMNYRGKLDTYITPKVPYTEADLDYNNSSSRVSMEHKDSSIRPEYTGDAANWDDYRVVYLGYPIWWGEAPAIVYTFTEHHSFEGKTVIPFATSYSSPLGDSGENLARAAKTGTWLPGECFTGGGKTDDVLRWIHSLKK